MTKPKDVAGEQKPVKEKSGWIVQTGVFAQRANADRVAARLKSGGYQPSVGPTTQKGVALYRVYVGPYASRDEAARASLRVGQTLHEKVAVVAYP
jgi:cell division septation protein DedD